jgi:pectate lyase
MHAHFFKPSRHAAGAWLPALFITAWLAACGGGDADPADVAAADPSAAATAQAQSAAGAAHVRHRPRAPGSLGADGFAAVAADGTPFTVTGGAAARRHHVHTVRNRAELVAALYGKRRADPARDQPDDRPKIIHVQGTIDLDTDARGRPVSPDADLRACTTAFPSAAAFYAAYKAQYDPNLWIRQSLDAADNRPPVLPLVAGDGQPTLEGIRLCAATQQAARIVLRVGSNTSILGLGADARIVRGSLRIGDFRPGTEKNADGLTVLAEDRHASNIVIRNITFEDSYDAWPSWDPKDSFSIAASEFGTGRCAAAYDAVADTGPHQCATRRGGRWNAEYDLIQVLNGSQVWIDHNTFSDGDRPDSLDPPVPEWAAPFNVREQKVQHHDGTVDVTLLGSRVTLSFNHFKDHDKGHLIGGTDVAERFATVRDGLPAVVGSGPDQMWVTFHHNRYENIMQRQPRVRFGKVHVYNNLYMGQLRPSSSSLPAPAYPWSVGYAIGTASKLYVEANVFDLLPGAPGDTLPSAARLMFGDSLASTRANQARCTAAGYAEADCATWFFESLSLLNDVLVPEGALLAAAQARGTGSNAPVNRLDASYWTPGASYPYQADDVLAVRPRVLQEAGAGRL